MQSLFRLQFRIHLQGFVGDRSIKQCRQIPNEIHCYQKPDRVRIIVPTKFGILYIHKMNKWSLGIGTNVSCLVILTFDGETLKVDFWSEQSGCFQLKVAIKAGSKKSSIRTQDCSSHPLKVIHHSVFALRIQKYLVCLISSIMQYLDCSFSNELQCQIEVKVTLICNSLQRAFQICDAKCVPLMMFCSAGNDFFQSPWLYDQTAG